MKENEESRGKLEDGEEEENENKEEKEGGEIECNDG